MGELFVLAEHRMGVLRDVTFEMLSKGRELAGELDADLSAILLGYEIDDFAKTLAMRADKVLVFDGVQLENFNSEAYQQVLCHLIRERKPILTLIGHTSFGIDLAPALAVELGIPLATDCINLNLEDGKVLVTRQIYGGKLNVEASLRKAENYLVTIRPATFESAEANPVEGDIIKLDLPLKVRVENKKFVDYVEPPPGEVDIAEADIIVSVGRGMRDEKNIAIIEEMAMAVKGEIGCSRPIVDKGWLPKDRQVGSSGKTVKPKLYVAIGISGSFQHIIGMKSSGLIVAINKDSKAPIFRIADYGIVDDLFKIVPALTQKLKELKQ
ncbi:MAG: electron transfer flavoprotein subunit alpha/FixB family protein [Candidatus Bathyarchaeia archaeon]